MENNGYINTKILYNEKVASNIYKIRVEGKFAGVAGQFYMLRAWNSYPYLSRPISIYDIGEDYIDFLYAVVGEGTEIISNKKVGDEISLLGPLGNGFDTEKKYGKVALVSGGIGIAPLLYLAKNIKAEEIHLLAGFRDEVYCTDEFLPYANVKVATEDGSIGTKGFVTELIKQENYDTIFVCGPKPMMIAIKNLELPAKTYLSLEAYMGCGIGACLGCQIKIKDRGVLRICHEGPVFDAKEIEFDA